MLKIKFFIKNIKKCITICFLMVYTNNSILKNYLQYAVIDLKIKSKT